MEIGVGLDASLGMTWADQVQLSKESAQLGFTSIWTPEGNGVDSFHLCVQRWMASREIVPEGLVTGIGVSPVMYRTPLSFAMAGGTVSEITGGKFIMGIGSGGAYQPRARRVVGLGRLSAMQLMRDYVTVIRDLVSGERVNYESDNMKFEGLRLGMSPPPQTPVYLGALGPMMLELSGELADGASLNWCTPEQIAWSRERIDAGAAKAGRDPSDIKMVEYIRICVDDDEDAARVALAKATMGYALGPTVPTERESQLGYRGHFARMGFEKELADLNQMRSDGASRDEVAEAFPTSILNAVGYFGKADGAAAAFKRLSEGLDTTIVRVVAARRNLDSVRAVMEACSPAKIEAA
ncbi:MAG: LLM class flavin-dependent oxidoreductase [SAR202 cluster bacterium]|nr:LLM class flavin-dependent oxidoreductase [SAR202 cluster bacterium]MDP6513090.1 LLM class flavin-dependent oxidoreductase [SAR202 cluster bacterium]MDP6714028.1 LLM class flavin-dependent oxidoreductase [SAR202 cluster bacterium]